MRAGMAKVDITPDRCLDLGGFRSREQPMLGVLDRLFVRAVAFEDSAGGRAAVLIPDNLAVPAPLVSAIRSQLEVAGTEVHVAATHTHSAPCLARLRDCGECDPDYARFFVERSVEAAVAALDAMHPARMAVSRAEARVAVDRRRQWLKLDRPPQLDPDVLALWLYDDDPARPFGAVVNAACHAVVLSGRYASADWPGAACREIESALGAGASAAVLVGAGANLNPIERGAPEQAERMGQAVARAALGAPREPLVQDEPVRGLSVVHRMAFQMPVETDLEADVRALDEGGPDIPPARMTCLKWARDRLADLRAGRLAPRLDLTLAVLAVGEVRFAFVPFETFTETGRAIRSAAPGRVLVASCADGIYGYLPIASAYAEGGYEVETAHRFYDVLAPAPGAAEALADVVRGMVSRLG